MRQKNLNRIKTTAQVLGNSDVGVDGSRKNKKRCWREEVLGFYKTVVLITKASSLDPSI